MQSILCKQCKKELPSPRPFESTHPTFLRSDYSPTDQELSYLKEVLEKEEEQLRWHENDIATLRQRLEVLSAGKRTVEANIRQCRSVISTKWRLPVELWEHIFTTLCNSLHDYSFEVDDTGYKEPAAEMPPVVISQVCARWREIAHNCPKLWSSLSIEFNDLSRNINFPLTTYLEKAKNYPLTIRLERYDQGFDSDIFPPLATQQSRDAWAFLAPNLFRCARLTVKINNYNFPEVPFGLSFPNLTTFCEERYGKNGMELPDGINRPRWYWDAVRAAPKLTEAAIYCFHPTDSIPYQQLTSLSLLFICGGVEAEPLFLALSTCTNLVSLKLNSLNDREMASNWPPQTIALPSLLYLSIDTKGTDLPRARHPNRDNILLSRFCLTLKMRSLIDFSIECHVWPPHLTHMLEKNSSSLRQVEIALLDDRLPDYTIRDHLLGLLQTLPRLCHLKLFFGEKRAGFTFHRFHGIPEDLTSVDDLFSTFLSKLELPGPYTLLPNLESLSLSFSQITLNDEITESILNLVSRRLEASSPLKACCLTRRDSEIFTPSAPMVEKINVLKQQGVIVVVEGIGSSD
ncbi:hypothetical protein PQX77_012234 [Marasmius sp. AFHP31]|nr:hypothetical protein PQX77_012234 [Marasmius sp. AFHP31]